MPVTPKYPGVYIQEAPSTSHVIGGDPTSNTAFVDVFERGPANVPQKISGWREFESMFGGFDRASRASYGISQFFLNGGSTAYVVRITGDRAVSATVELKEVGLTANGPGTWGNQIEAATQPNTHDPGLFDLAIRELSRSSPSPTVVTSEIYSGLSTDPEHPNFVTDVLYHQSALVRTHGPVKIVTARSSRTRAAPHDVTDPGNVSDPTDARFAANRFTGGVDDLSISGRGALGDPGDPEVDRAPTGYYTLPSIAPSVFNILCLPAMAAFDADAWADAYLDASSFCETHRAFFIVDVPQAVIDSSKDTSVQVDDVERWFLGLGSTSDHSAVYFPRIEIPDPARSGGPSMETEVSGTLAGIYARTDSSRGVWKAPAGNAAALVDAVGVTAKIDDADNGRLNPLGINVIREFPLIGTVSWGARTMAGGDLLQSQWKYVSVRRTALYIEASLARGTNWAVFEPNDEALWASLRLSVGSFMDSLYKQGALAGSSAKDAYFVACDATTTTPADQAAGRVNIDVGCAPLYPAEFVVIRISQITDR
ncbi:phage tail sheath family protein [Ilumatobacter sp.]|uniref:phage tail sheath family protein n=1 Tax=Ilumatobacter sp. TaxID=1967498 RepID=UPI003C551687